jgi:hypothetical protein
VRILAPSVGTVTSLRFWHDNSGFSPGLSPPTHPPAVFFCLVTQLPRKECWVLVD